MTSLSFNPTLSREAALTLPPISSRAEEFQNEYNNFFDYTSADTVQGYARGYSLTNLTSLAKKAISFIERSNPIWDTHNGPSGIDQSTALLARQWQIDHISDIKQRLAGAIVHKQSYYENHSFGKITKFFLQLFGYWNNGHTYAITTAEDLLLLWDSRLPLLSPSESSSARTCYMARYFFFLTSVTWVQDNLDTSRFFNYTPSRTIEFSIENIGQRSLREHLLPPTFVRV